MAGRKNEPIDNQQKDRHLFKLVELEDYEVASDDPDIRGWSVLDRNRKEVGRIDELIVDPYKEKVRYLDVVPNTERSVNEGDQHLLIPVGAARIDDHENKVIIDEIDQDRLENYPMYRGDYISRDIESQIVERFNRPESLNQQRSDSVDFYAHELYDESRLYSSRNKNRNK